MDFNIFRLFCFRDLHLSIGGDSCEFKSWVAKGNYNVNSIGGNGEIELFVSDYYSLKESIGYDFSRFACAAYESVKEIRQDSDLSKATAWAAIRCYYAAFFAAHAILRYFGMVCTQLDNDQARLLSKYASLYGVSNKAQPGFYEGIYDDNFKIIKLRKLSDTHKDTWACFDRKLKNISQLVLSSSRVSSEKNEIATLLDDVSNSIEDGGRLAQGNWLSVYRNNLNYKQAYDAWYPFKRSSIKFEQLDKYLNRWKNVDFNPLDGVRERDERLRFFGTCFAILSLMHGLVTDTATLAKKKSVHVKISQRLAKM